MILLATLCHVLMDCTPLITTLPKCNENPVKPYLRADITWVEGLFLHLQVAGILFVAI